MKDLKLELLGAFKVTYNGKPVTDFPTVKTRALLAYLAIEKKGSRRRVARLLWPFSEGARKNLSTEFYRLRHEALKEPKDDTLKFFSADRDNIRFDPNQIVWVDVNEFEKLLAIGCQAHRTDHLESCTECIERLEQAVELYRGDFLANFVVDDVQEFEEWCRDKKNSLEGQLVVPLSKLGTYYEQQRQYEQVQKFTERLLKIEPWHENAHRQLMRALALSGQRNSALKQYETCCEELGVEPAQETKTLYDEILHGRLKPIASPAPPPVKPELERPVSDQMPQEEQPQAAPVEPAEKSNVADVLSEQQKQEEAVSAVAAAEADDPVVEDDEQDEQEQPPVLPPVKDLSTFPVSSAPLSEPPVVERQDEQMERRSWSEILALFQSKSRRILAVVVVFLLVFISVRLLSPQIAILYNAEGFRDYRARDLSSAKANYEWAIWWNAEYAEAHYNLGLLYEDWQEFDQARTEYDLAMKGGLDAAYNNLARLYIIRYEKYEEAVDLLREGLDQTEKNEENNEVKYAMHKNLGWAQLKQEDYAAAESHLRAAIGLDSKKAPAYCLLAQVRDKQNRAVKALESWDKCLEHARSDNLDEDEWIKMARERLNEGGE